MAKDVYFKQRAMKREQFLTEFDFTDATVRMSVLPKELVCFNSSRRTTGLACKLGAVLKPSKDDDALLSRQRAMGHLRELKSQRYADEFEFAPFVGHASERTGLCARNRLTGALRDHSNAVAIVAKSSPSQASNLQITRVPIACIGTAEIANQFATLQTLDLARDFAFVGPSDPTPSARRIRAEFHNTEKLFVVSQPACELLEHAPRSLRATSFLAMSRALAQAELDSFEISKIVVQTTDHLLFTCKRIVCTEDASDGSCTWFAWSLLSYLATDFQLHPLLEKWGFTEFDLAVSISMVGYARRLVGNRSRDMISRLDEGSAERAKRALSASNACAQLWRAANSRFVDNLYDDDDDAEDESDFEGSDASGRSSDLADAAALRRVVCMQQLARKARKTDSGLPKPPPAAKRGARAEGVKKQRASNTVSGAPKVRASLEFLHFHFLQADGLLTHLFADSEQACSKASDVVLKSQLRSKDINAELKTPAAVSLFTTANESALQSRRMLLPLVEQPPERSPSIVSSVGSDGVARTRLLPWTDSVESSDLCDSFGRTRVMACAAPVVAQPCASSKTTVVWSAVSTATQDARTARAFLDAYRSGQEGARELAPSPYGPSENGITRSVLVFDAIVPMSSEVLSAAMHVAKQLEERHRVVVESTKSLKSLSGNRPRRVCPETDLDAARMVGLSEETPQPDVTCSNVFTIGMFLLECARASANSSHKQSILAVPIAPEAIPSSVEGCVSECKRVHPKARPWCFLNVSDIKFEARTPERLLERTAQDEETCQSAHVCHVETHVSATVCGDRVLPVTTAMRHIAIELLKLDRIASSDVRRSLLRQWRSLCYASGIQCASYHQFSNSVAAREMNTKAESGAKGDAPDNHYLAFPTIYQAYVASHTNLPTLFEGTPWMGTYGVGYECGAIASVGINARNIVSDQRNAAFATMDQDQIDSLCIALSECAVVPCPERQIAAVPMGELGGLPRAMLVGVHKALDGLDAAFKTLATSLSLTEETKSSIQVLPFSPFTQAVPPFVSAESNGMNFRENARSSLGMGVANACQPSEYPRPLRTLRNYSILQSSQSDLLRQVCVKLKSSQTDNPFETIEPAVASVLVFASQLAEVAGLVSQLAAVGAVGADRMSTFRMQALAFFEPGGLGVDDPCVATLLVDGFVLLNSIFPLQFDVGEPCLLGVLARAPHAVLTRPASDTRRFCDLGLTLSSDEERDWNHFLHRVLDDSSSGPWSSICNFVETISERGCTFDNSVRDMKACCAALEALCRATWLVHSSDGTSPPKQWSPLHERASPESVLGSDINCVWVDRPHTSQTNRKTQRGALIGLPNAGPQQVLSLLLGAFLEDIVVQYVRNEGNMALRISACALKQHDGTRLSAKSTSPLYNEGDAEVFGSLEAKGLQARRQTRAWRANNDLIFRVATRFTTPKDNRFAGAMFNLDRVQKTIASWNSVGRVSKQQCDAERLMQTAILGALDNP